MYSRQDALYNMQQITILKFKKMFRDQ